MALFSNHKKPIATLLILAIFVSLILGPVILLYPKKAKAQFVVIDPAAVALLGIIAATTGTTAAATTATAAAAATTAVTEVEETADKWLTRAVRVLGQILLRQILAMMTNEIINWINGGGTPRFVSDWGGFLKDAADAAAGAFIDEYLGQGWLCEPFDLDIKIALLPEPKFEERVKCTLSDVVDNIEDFYDDFSKGGWRAWVELTKPRNNIYGAYFLALDAKMGAAASAREAAEKEAMAGSGFLGEKDEFGRVKTPGKLIADIASKAVTYEIDLLREQIADLADSLGPFEIYVVAITNALINRVIDEGFSLIGIGDDRAVPGPTREDYERYQRGEIPELPPPAEGEPYPSEENLPLGAVYAQAKGDLTNAQNLHNYQIILKDNLTKLLGQQTLSLGVLQEIKEKQEEILEELQADYANGYSLPSWASVQENIFPNIDQITANNIGTISLIKTATSTYEFGSPQPQAQARIDELKTGKDGIGKAGIEEVRGWIALAGFATKDSSALIDRINEFITKYEKKMPESTLRDAQNKMQKAKNAAIETAQDFVESDSSKLYYLYFDTSNTAINVNVRALDLETTRGTEDEPTEGTLYEELDDLEEKLEEI